jgi:hypothetical protein
MTLTNEDGSSSYANRVRTPGGTPLTILPGTGVSLIYNLNVAAVAPTGRWVVLHAGAHSNDWTILGNAGTTPLTNFIGTTDLQDFVTKTGGSAATNERIRVLSDGRVRVNQNANYAGVVFQVSGTGGTVAINPIGATGIGGFVGANGTGLYGESRSTTNNTSGYGVRGLIAGPGTTTTGFSIGTQGLNLNTPSGTGVAYGVSGYTSATTGDARGVQGESASSAGYGVLGISTAATGSGIGVYGQSAAPASTAIYGYHTATALTTNASSAIYGAINGTVTTGLAAGLWADAFGTTGNGVYGVFARSYSPTGRAAGFVGNAGAAALPVNGVAYGVVSNVLGSLAAANSVAISGSFNNAELAGDARGVQAIVSSRDGSALLGFATTTNPNADALGVYGYAGTSAGHAVYGYNSDDSGTAVIGGGNGLIGRYLQVGSGGAFIGRSCGVVGFATTDTVTDRMSNFPANGLMASSGGYFEVQDGSPVDTGPAVSWSYVAVREAAGAGGLRKIIGNGTVNTIVKDLSGNYVAMSCPEAPENLFMDFGSGQLVNGEAVITLDPIFSKNIAVDNNHPLRVFIQLEGDCNGVYVHSKSKTGFKVKELQSGRSNVPFTYKVVANRADEVLNDGSIARYSIERFAPAPGPARTDVRRNQPRPIVPNDRHLLDVKPAKSPVPVKPATEEMTTTIVPK